MLSGLPWSAPADTKHMQTKGAGWSYRDLKGTEQENKCINCIYTPTPSLVLVGSLVHAAKSYAGPQITISIFRADA